MRRARRLPGGHRTVVTTDSDVVTRCGVRIPIAEVEFTATRSRGPGGQHVNKTATAVRLRFDIAASNALSEAQKARLLETGDSRLTSEGQIVIRADTMRSRRRNRDEALSRLLDFVDNGLAERTPRKATRPSRAARERRLRNKSARARLKQTRKPPQD